MKLLTNTILLIAFMICLGFSCRDGYLPGAVSSIICILLYVKAGIVDIRNRFLRDELDEGRKILTHLYDKYD